MVFSGDFGQSRFSASQRPINHDLDEIILTDLDANVNIYTGDYLSSLANRLELGETIQPDVLSDLRLERIEKLKKQDKQGEKR